LKFSHPSLFTGLFTPPHPFFFSKEVKKKYDRHYIYFFPIPPKPVHLFLFFCERDGFLVFGFLSYLFFLRTNLNVYSHQKCSPSNTPESTFFTTSFPLVAKVPYSFLFLILNSTGQRSVDSIPLLQPLEEREILSAFAFNQDLVHCLASDRSGPDAVFFSFTSLFALPP